MAARTVTITKFPLPVTPAFLPEMPPTMTSLPPPPFMLETYGVYHIPLSSFSVIFVWRKILESLMNLRARGTYRTDKAQCNCTFPSDVKMVVRLWSDNDKLVMECKRRRGDIAKFIEAQRSFISQLAIHKILPPPPPPPPLILRRY